SKTSNDNNDETQTINDGDNDESTKIAEEGGNGTQFIGEGDNAMKIAGEGGNATKIVGEGDNTMKTIVKKMLLIMDEMQQATYYTRRTPQKKRDQSVQPNDIDCSQSSETATTSAELQQPEIVEHSKATQNFQSSQYDIGEHLIKNIHLDQATSVFSEQLFSDAGQTYDPAGNRSKDGTVEN
uniref:Uncharacterized protein n=1 Tax=Romanomermis culicivorax TaxID=13658 RepID=A0A915I9Z7_ROMCU